VEFLRLALLFVHLTGLSLLLGGFASQVFARQFRISPPILYGAITQVVSGVLLSAPLGREVQPNPVKLAVKGVIAVLILAMVIVVRGKQKVAPGHFYSIGGLTLVNVAVAVFWH
jgi:hypothetical protein